MSGQTQRSSPSPSNGCFLVGTSQSAARTYLGCRWCSGRGAGSLARRFRRASPHRLALQPVSWNAFSSVRAGTRGRNDVTIRSHTLQKLEEITVRGKDKGCVFGDDGLVGLHGPCEFIERHRFRALVVSPRIDFGSFRVRHAADLLDLPVGFRLDLVQITHTIAADSGGLAVTFRQEALRDLPPFADHSIVNL